MECNNRYLKDIYMTKVNTVVFYIFPLLLMRFFTFNRISLDLQSGFSYMSILILFSMTFKVLVGSKYLNIKYFPHMKCILFSVLISILMSTIFWNQGLYRSITVSTPLLGIIYYFFLIKSQPSLNDVKRLVYIYTSVYIIIWLYAFIKVPEVVFDVVNLEGEIDEGRGVFRLNIIGRQFLVFGFFLALNNWIMNKKLLYLFVATICFVFIIFQVTRQVILLSFIIGIIYILLMYKYRYLLVIIGVTCFIFANNLKFNDDSLVGGLISRSEVQLDNNKSEDDIRLQATSFYLNEFPNNFLTSFFGNGVHYNKGELGIYLTKINRNYFYFLSDVGYVSMYIVLGLFGLILYLLLFIKISFSKINSNRFFAKLFIIYMLFSNIGADWYAKADGVILICLSVYILSKRDISVIKPIQKKYT